MKSQCTYYLVKKLGLVEMKQLYFQVMKVLFCHPVQFEKKNVLIYMWAVQSGIFLIYWRHK